MYNYIKRYFNNLNTLVDKSPLIGLGIMIAVAGSFMVVVYNSGKQLGDLLYWLLH